MRSKSRFTTLVLLESRESYLQIRVQSQDTRTLSTSSKCHLRVRRFIDRPIAFDGGYHSSRLGARNVRLGSIASAGRCPRYVCSAPECRPTSGVSASLKRATCGHGPLFFNDFIGVG